MQVWITLTKTFLLSIVLSVSAFAYKEIVVDLSEQMAYAIEMDLSLLKGVSLLVS